MAQVARGGGAGAGGLVAVDTGVEGIADVAEDHKDAVGGGGSVFENDTFGWVGEVADILVMADQQYPSVLSEFH